MSMNDSLRFGVLPRQLLLEALDSVQKVLFPISNPKCYALLQSLITKCSFDPDCLRFESSTIRNDDEKDISYHYFGSRFVELYEELQRPATHNPLEKWLERKSAPR
ncbi:uncharacterized protein A1O9_03228 [Exophiala aquamarina CBS 119918]|uniref:Uncharacterized protein n=1 Tax=Exophiala aquamarina CBS 119918 TaxID=1182545 RepID=A0A072Q182_9EURO|nr:uncharacterized protein A1O9_03228 [Exophiala aquamarina CBS 119918]KEF61660.1 hypothetical protein A1O9_03228 [Exophiala aquamarina CBS 119918]